MTFETYFTQKRLRTDFIMNFLFFPSAKPLMSFQVTYMLKTNVTSRILNTIWFLFIFMFWDATFSISHMLFNTVCGKEILPSQDKIRPVIASCMTQYDIFKMEMKWNNLRQFTIIQYMRICHGSWLRKLSYYKVLTPVPTIGESDAEVSEQRQRT